MKAMGTQGRINLKMFKEFFAERKHKYDNADFNCCDAASTA